MHIYIYGGTGFKKTVHSTLDRANVKFRLDDDSTIEDINSLEALKLAIESEPDNIYLIDQEKIIDKKSLNSKIKFLTPKDGIEKEFLDKNGIEDISVDSIEDLPKYVIRKLESLHLTDTFDDTADQSDDTKDVSSISEEEIDAISDILDDIENIEPSKQNSENEDDFDLDDDFKDLLSIDDEESEDKDDFELDDDKDVEIKTTIDPMDDVSELMDINIEEESTNQGVEPMEELNELDNLQEDDMLAALNGLDDIDASAVTAAPVKNDSISIDSSNVNDLASLITQLLNNKTLEITVKIKE